MKDRGLKISELVHLFDLEVLNRGRTTTPPC